MKRSLWLSLYSKINGINILYISDHWYQKNKILGLFFPNCFYYIYCIYICTCIQYGSNNRRIWEWVNVCQILTWSQKLMHFAIHRLPILKLPSNGFTTLFQTGLLLVIRDVDPFHENKKLALHYKVIQDHIYSCNF